MVPIPPRASAVPVNLSRISTICSAAGTAARVRDREGRGASQGSAGEEMKPPKNGVESEERGGPWETPREAAEDDLEN